MEVSITLTGGQWNKSLGFLDSKSSRTGGDNLIQKKPHQPTAPQNIMGPIGWKNKKRSMPFLPTWLSFDGTRVGLNIPVPMDPYGFESAWFTKISSWRPCFSGFPPGVRRPTAARGHSGGKVLSRYEAGFTKRQKKCRYTDTCCA